MSALLSVLLLAFGGTYLWGAVIAAVGSTLILAVSRPAMVGASGPRLLDASLLAVVLIAVAQVVPLPQAVNAVCSPARATLLAELTLAPAGPWQPLTINTADSMHAILVLASAVLLFWAARGLFHYGGVRTVTRAVAISGLLVAIVGVLQDASRAKLIYWWWAPRSEGAPGFGPFINRNHFAAWTVMALSLTIGYVAARTHARDDMDRYRSFVSRLRRRWDLRSVWLALAIVLMTIALVLTLSRSGLAAAVVGVLAARMMVAGRHRRARGWATGAAGAVIVMAILWTGPATLVDRWRSAEIGQEGRSLIWRETMPVVRDFWLTGTGVGTYGRAMAVYQQSDRERVHFNQAHNHYLQVLAEGGLLLFAACAVAAVLFVRAAAERMRRDHTGMLWLRVGSAAGLTGLAVSSIWETAARMPANALLAAVLAAIVLHDTRHHSSEHIAVPREDV